MKPDMLDELGNDHMQVQPAGRRLANEAPLPKEYAIVLRFKSVREESKLLDKISTILESYTPEDFLMYNTDQEHVYLLAFDFKEAAMKHDLDNMYKALTKTIGDDIGTGDICIQAYYTTDIYLTTNKTVEAVRCILDIHANKDIPLDLDFIYMLTNKYSVRTEMFPISVDSKVLHITQ
jgi:hypothetical protein